VRNHTASVTVLFIWRILTSLGKALKGAAYGCQQVRIFEPR